ncbi:MAG: response regulator transcription factor [Verrucomicrobia bacterium]|nr:response regulator transcription factor [Verrucomicrobiota bacterium]
MKRDRILVVEDDDLHYELYEEALEDCELIRARSASEALAKAAQFPPDLIILDHVLAEGELGLEFLPELKELLPHVPIIVISGVLETDQQLDALQGPRRAHYCLNKPIDLDELRRTVETALKECGEKEIVRQFTSLEHAKRADIEELLTRSTDRLARQTEIKKLLQNANNRPNISALARRFGVARRTIIRDLHELIRRGEIPPEIYPPWDAGGNEPSEQKNDRA